MKDFITTIASIFLLMMFVMQFAVSQGTSHKVLQADMAVSSFRDCMKQQGHISRENQESLRSALAEICGCRETEIQIEGSFHTGAPQERGSLLYYQVQYPLNNLIAMAAGLGISDEDNRVYFEQKGWVVSIYEEPDSDRGDFESDDHGNPVRE